MKTILVLTDFTIKADHAAHYALKLAQKIKANLLLCNVYPEVIMAPASTHTFWTSNDTSNFEQDSINDLADLAARLNKQLAKYNDDEFKPRIEFCSKAGPLTNAINYLVASREILFAVIATHNGDDILAFLNGNHANEIIENANCPVLVLPYQSPFNGFNKIAFATDLAHNGTDILHSLYHITKYFDSEVLITHVGVAKLAKVTEDYITRRFLRQEIAATHYPKIQYQSVQNKSITAGLQWLAEHSDIDLLVLVHHKRNFFQKIFEPSVTKKLADHFAKPMLVFPSSYERGSVPI
ncbi:universal stress protein [Mucilaginibacter sp. UR6-11]|uniref:universal stress protein n=1 Tax=Mucilaginibacter sp. UR6-11 TaxID=1435644 RepID=UPI001E430DEF|nr:universal stress protein [Mucilaginibacter sp. UR6-11]MCC8424916.1 universal stress protein [Mucilaginibacter sp. UR6-11]